MLLISRFSRQWGEGTVDEIFQTHHFRCACPSIDKPWPLQGMFRRNSARKFVPEGVLTCCLKCDTVCTYTSTPTNGHVSWALTSQLPTPASILPTYCYFQFQQETIVGLFYLRQTGYVHDIFSGEPPAKLHVSIRANRVRGTRKPWK